MTYRFGQLMFTPTVKRVQAEHGSRAAYARLEESGGRENGVMSEIEGDFIAARDSFYLATVSETGWPYVQHRGGPTGFLKTLDDRTLGFADYRGNRQYVSVGNLLTNDRVSLFLMDYPNRRRLKIMGHARSVERTEDSSLFSGLGHNDEAKIERGVIIRVETFDWNCPQYITPRHTEAELLELFAPVREELAALRAENAMLRASVAAPST